MIHFTDRYFFKTIIHCVYNYYFNILTSTLNTEFKYKSKEHFLKLCKVEILN